MTSIRTVLLALVALLFAALIGVSAQVVLPTMMADGGGAGAAYTGPGDVVSGALAWYGLRGYNAAYSTGSNPAIDITSPSTHTINILSNGNLDMATALSDASGAGSATCTISGTTLSCLAGGTGAFEQFGNITGAGLVYPAYITSAGGCGSWPCTATLNQAQTVSVGETITGYHAMNIVKWYDQSGGNNCGGAACNQSQTGTVLVYLINKCFGTLPCAFWNNQAYTEPTNLTSTNTPFTVSSVGERFGATSVYGIMMAVSNGSTDTNIYWNNTTNTVAAGAASAFSATASDSAIHAMQFVLNGASSVINIDGTETTGTVGAGTAGTRLYYGSNLFGNSLQDVYSGETGIWASALSSTNRTKMCHNQYLYWGTATSC